ncbi:ABC transporter permease [Arenibaculum pallidiluteum]|uniref:ABC transporter permease n=1 Tax=Arenibaculum pallidiluteum TaxID=2812559 RepID=UPI001A95A83F|nr:ABC transporter permease [Arenibaculum pallidiluteum]
MLAYASRRLALLTVTLLAASMLIFLVTSVLPGNVGRIMLGPFAAQDSVDTLNRQLGLDRPVLERYAVWLAAVVQGDWGRSLHFNAPVLPLVIERLGRSLLLAAVTLAILVPSAVAAGIHAARREGGVFDRTVSLLGLSVRALPEFVTGVVLIVVFGIQLGWLPVQALPPEGAGPVEVLRHLLMPALCLVLVLFAYVFRMTRAGVIEALAADWTRTARLKGLPPSVVVLRHVLRNALLPTIAVLGAQIGWLVGGLVVVETLFRYPGIGTLIQFAATAKDLPLLVGCAVAVTAVFALGNLAADLLAASLDPRIRHGSPRG